MKFTQCITAVGLLLVCTAYGQAPADKDHAAHHPQAASQVGASSAQMADGEVRKIDKEQGKLTLRHGPIASLEMPAMTMVFRVADPKLLDALKAGDKVKFSAVNLNGAYTITALEPAK